MHQPDHPSRLSTIAPSPWRAVPTLESIRIETPRLIVSDFRPDDLTPLHGIFKNMKAHGQNWFNASADAPGSVDKFLALILANQQDTPRHTYRLALRKKEPDSPPRLVGYVSLCDIHSRDSDKPDTGVLVDPACQRDGLAREGRVANMLFGFGLGLDRMVCDIKTSNTPSINNVLGMGYQQVMQPEGTPLIVKTHTLRGHEDWYRFSISRETFLANVGGLINKIADRHWSDLHKPVTPVTAWDKAVAELTHVIHQPLPTITQNNQQQGQNTPIINTHHALGPFVVSFSKRPPQIHAAPV
jgi:RimJ/RimL family protein N-acetyltransferase